MFQNYFQDLFTKSDRKEIKDYLQPKKTITIEEMNEMLLQEFTSIKIKEVVFQINPLGSPGLDGVLAIFFEDHWNIIGQDVIMHSWQPLIEIDGQIILMRHS